MYSMSQTIDVLNHLSSLNPPKILLEFESADDRNSATYYFKLLGQFIISHVLTNTEGYVLWRNRARSMSVVANENNDVTMFREVNCKMRLFAMKYSIEFEEKIN